MNLQRFANAFDKLERLIHVAGMGFGPSVSKFDIEYRFDSHSRAAVTIDNLWVHCPRKHQAMVIQSSDYRHLPE